MLNSVHDAFDVVVAGGGPSGVMAAIAAARNGARTMLIERYGFLGGMATNALVGPLQSFHAGDEQVAVGLAQEMIDRLQAIGGTPGHVPDMVGFVPTVTPVDVEKMKYVLQEMAEESDVFLQLHTVVTGADVDKSGELKELHLYNKSGHLRVKASVFIDCTGDGDVVAMAGVPYEKGRKSDGLAQPMTMMFRMGGVNFDSVRSYVKAHPEEFVLADDWESFPMVGISGFFSLVNQAKREKRLTIERDRVLLFELPAKGEVTVNMTRVIRHDATDGQALSSAEVLGRRQVMEVVEFLKSDIPGFENAELINCGTQIGVRESRRIVGKYILSGEDVVQGRKFDDVIARGSYPIDIHSPDGGDLDVIQMERGTSYDIPYRCVINDSVHNLLVAGRCLSATHEALASARVTPTAMVVGQAVGIAAALAVNEQCSPHDVDVKQLQALICEQKGNLGVICQ
ncbi:FAD-dependent oxidoreductase [Numidum massiliense]|uniref:FAD-dependent oxidoreductase n=1 Tax=Numidum massiliense TaxID=1522315 RepID=UPI0006D56167|nr:FAD-dependent oxidoreductase [Numidum massiliense]